MKGSGREKLHKNLRPVTATVIAGISDTMLTGGPFAHSNFPTLAVVAMCTAFLKVPCASFDL
jgi:hypothetical protein